MLPPGCRCPPLLPPAVAEPLSTAGPVRTPISAIRVLVGPRLLSAPRVEPSRPSPCLLPTNRHCALPAGCAPRPAASPRPPRSATRALPPAHRRHLRPAHRHQHAATHALVAPLAAASPPLHRHRTRSPPAWWRYRRSRRSLLPPPRRCSRTAPCANTITPPLRPSSPRSPPAPHRRRGAAVRVPCRLVVGGDTAHGAADAHVAALR